jgi:hypothetical protein
MKAPLGIALVLAARRAAGSDHGTSVGEILLSMVAPSVSGMERGTVVARHDPKHDHEDACPAAKAAARVALGRKAFHMGCEPLVVWQLAQLTRPDAKHFLEVHGGRLRAHVAKTARENELPSQVLCEPLAFNFGAKAGANLGYYGARIFALWSPGTGLKPTALQEELGKHWRGSSTFGTCHDGVATSDPVPLRCDRGVMRLSAAQPLDETLCGADRRDVRFSSSAGIVRLVRLTNVHTCVSCLCQVVQYHAFDGSSAFVTNVSALVQGRWPGIAYTYELAAVMHRPGPPMMFAQRNDEGGHLLVHSKVAARVASMSMPFL